MSWAPDKRNYHDIKGALNHDYSRKFPNKLRPGETWIAEVLLEKLALILPEVTLYMSPNDQSNLSYAHLLGKMRCLCVLSSLLALQLSRSSCNHV